MRKIKDTFVPPKRSPDFGAEPHVRSYVLDRPLVKDLRTGVTSGDPQAVLDGEIDDFLRASLALPVVLHRTKPTPE